MFEVEDSAVVNAPLDRCFMLATSIELVAPILGLRAVEGKRRGFIEDRDRILWRGWKFGLPALHETLITGYARPDFFQDTMGRGRFKHFQHDHHFTEAGGQTTMHDVVRFSLPFGLPGRLVARLVMRPYILALMKRRFALLKRTAESDAWQGYLPPAVTAHLTR